MKRILKFFTLTLDKAVVSSGFTLHEELTTDRSLNFKTVPNFKDVESDFSMCLLTCHGALPQKVSDPAFCFLKMICKLIYVT